MSINVTLDASCDARFPDICVLCGHRGPGDTLALSTGLAGSWQAFFGLHAGQRQAHVPACLRCRELMTRQAQLRSWGVLVAIVASFALYGVLVSCYHGPLTNVVRAGGLVFFMLPYFVWEALFPLPINVTATKSTITYKFEYDIYGLHFERLNRPGDGQSGRNSDDERVAEVMSAARADDAAGALE